MYHKRLQTQLLKSLIGANCIWICFWNYQKAFDTLDHNILLKKLKFYGIKDTEFKRFKSHLTGLSMLILVVLFPARYQ